MATFLRPIKETPDDWDAVEKAIRDLFRKLLYVPILREISEPSKVMKNSLESLVKALQDGRITYAKGRFSGSFNATLSKELKGLGATFDRSSGSFKITERELPYAVRSAVKASEHRFQEKLEKIDARLSQLSPKELSEKLSVEKHFDRALWKVDRDFHSSVKGITIAPKLSAHQRQRIALEWGENMQLWVQEFAEKEIKELRQNVMRTAFSGNRRESMIQTIQDSYGVTANKAKFLARQETSLLMTKFKQTRYQSAGVEYYKWGCVTGSKNHPVRPWHRALEGKVFRWDDPPITTQPGTPVRRNNPGQDYNCRCFARPLVGYQPGRKDDRV